MDREQLADLVIFKAVAEESSFTKAAARLGLSQPTLSQTISDLEARIGVRLLARTTRSVRTTEAGQRLLATVQPVFAELDAQMASLSELRDKPSGTVRLTAIKYPAMSIVLPKLSDFLERYPDVKVELNIDDAFTDIVADGFDAGIRLGDQIEKDMVGVQIGPDVRAAVVASPAYFERHHIPNTPRELGSQNCVNFRLASRGDIYRWRFWEKGRPLDVKVEGSLVLNDGDALVAAALAGQGLVYVFDDHVAEDIRTGRLIRCLEDFCPPFPGYHLYYPSRRNKSAALCAFIDAIRYRTH
jgi:DNA-binding transcriptional LysR family regulator